MIETLAELGRRLEALGAGGDRAVEAPGDGGDGAVSRAAVGMPGDGGGGAVNRAAVATPDAGGETVNCNKNALSDVVDRAAGENPWFFPAEIRRAAANLASDMLSPRALSEWLARYPALPVDAPKSVLVVMAGNIPFVGVHDLVCVVASGHRALVKPSSKDAVLMSWVVGELLDIDPGLLLTLVPADYGRELSTGKNVHISADSLAAARDATFAMDGDGAAIPGPHAVITMDSNNMAVLPPDAVIAMGSDDAVGALREKYAGIPMLLRGNRSSLAVLDGTETPRQLAALADDVLSFSGLGCRNVSLVFAPRGYDFRKFQHVLYQYESELNLKHRNNYRQARALLKMNAVSHIDCHSCLLVEDRDFSNNVSVLNYAFYDTLSKVTDWINDHDGAVQCVACPPSFKSCHPRAVAPGQTQRPSLGDYPDGRDTMEFLSSLSLF